MARARDRAPSQHAYRGTVGATRTAILHVSRPIASPGGPPGSEIVPLAVHVAVDVVADPELGQRLLSDDPELGLNVVRDGDGQAIVLSVPVVYHDPAAEIFALVVGPSDRHRELELRSKLLAELATDVSSPVPAYVRDAAVVFGAAGLRVHLEHLAERTLAHQRAAEHGRELERERATGERRKVELTGREAEVDRRAGAVSDRARELDRRASELDGRAATVAAREAEVEGQEADLARRQHEIEAAHADLARRWQELESTRAELTARGNALDHALEHARTNPVRIIRNPETGETLRPTRASEPPTVVVIPPRVARASAPAPAASTGAPAPTRTARTSGSMRAIEVQTEATTVAPAVIEPGPVDAETTNPFELVEPSAIDPLPPAADPLTTVTLELPAATDPPPPRVRPGDPEVIHR